MHAAVERERLVLSSVIHCCTCDFGSCPDAGCPHVGFMLPTCSGSGRGWLARLWPCVPWIQSSARSATGELSEPYLVRVCERRLVFDLGLEGKGVRSVLKRAVVPLPSVVTYWTRQPSISCHLPLSLGFSQYFVGNAPARSPLCPLLTVLDHNSRIGGHRNRSQRMVKCRSGRPRKRPTEVQISRASHGLLRRRHPLDTPEALRPGRDTDWSR